MKTTAIVVVIAAVWVAPAPVLAWFMRRRGYDGMSWLAVGVVLGPPSIALAVMERYHAVAPEPEPVVFGAARTGAVNLLVSLDYGEDVADIVRPLVRTWAADLGRVTFVHVLPQGGPGAERDHAAIALMREHDRLGDGAADALLLFGRRAQALIELATTRGYGYVVTTYADVDLLATFRDGPVRLLVGADAVQRLIADAA